MSSHTASTATGPHRPLGRRPARSDGLRIPASLFAATVAFSAYAGVVGMVGGGLTFPDEIDRRLPLDSYLLAGLALLFFVAVPMTLATVALVRRWAYATDVLEAAGVVLVVWIAVELAFIKTYSWLHPTYLAVAVVAIGLAMVMRAGARHER